MTNRARARVTLSHLQGCVGLPDPFPLHHGGSLPGQGVRYSMLGPDAGPTVVVLGGISADRYPARWWSDVVGEGGAIDTRRLRVLGIDWIGARTPDTVSATPGRDLVYPLVSTRDQAAALVAVLDELRIDSVEAIVGSSYGGMVGLSAAAAYPSRFPHVVAISAAHRSHPMATAHRSLQRDILELGRKGGHAREGVILARALAMTTYRTIEEFEERFAVDPEQVGGARFPVEEYLLARGRAFSDAFDAEAFATLSHSIDLHAVVPAEVESFVDLISIDTDRLVPRWLMDELEEGLAGPCRHHRLGSPWGHDAFLKDEAVARCLEEILCGDLSSPIADTHQGSARARAVGGVGHG